MTTNFHGPIIAGESNSPATVNSRLATLDAAIGGINSAGGGGVFTLANGSAATTTLTVDSTTGFVAGADVVYYHTSGTVREFNTIATVDSATQLTLGTTPGGTIADNAVVAQTVKSIRNALEGWYNVLDYGALGDGTTDDRAAINAAITAANAAGGGTVYMPPGTYSVTAGASPNGSQVNYGSLYMRSNVTLAGAGQEATIIKLANAQDGIDTAGVRIITHYNDLLGGTDSDFHFRDFTVDGNYANQGGLTKLRDTGILCNYATRVSHTRVTVRGVYGTSAGGSPSGEGFGYHAVVSRDISYSDCFGYGGGNGTNTATNFGLSSSTNVRMNNCTAYDSGKANGFAANNSANILYVNCHSYLNLVHGFNLEFARNVIYDNCIGGGIPATQTAGGFSCKTITTPGVTFANPAVVTSVAHGFIAGDYVYIGGNVNTAAQTEIVGAAHINDKIYKVGTVTADTFQLLRPSGENFDPTTRTIANISGTTTVTVDTSAAHNLLTGDVITVTGTTNFNVSNVAITKTDADSFTFSATGHATPETAGTVTWIMGTAAVGAWTAGGIICPILGNDGQGFRNQGGRSVEYNSCQATANGYGTGGTNHGLGIQESHHRVIINGGTFRFNRGSGVHYSSARPNHLRFAGYPVIENNYGGTNLATTIKNMDTATTLVGDVAASTTSTTVQLTADGAGAIVNGTTIEIILDNGDSHIIAVSGKTTPNYTFTIASMPSKATAGNAVYLLKAPVMTWPAAAILSNPSTNLVTGQSYINEYPFSVMVTVVGATSVWISGSTTGFSTGQFVIPPGGNITVNHSSATWRWFQA